MIEPTSPSRSAAVIGSAKAAALYYDRILPLPGRQEHVQETYELLEMPSHQITNLIDSDLIEYQGLLSSLASVAKTDEDELRDRLLHQSTGAIFSNIREQAVYRACCECHIAQTMELVMPELPTIDTKSAKKKKASVNSVLVHVMNLQIVEAESATWDQILAFREDPEACAAFRRMRDFLFTSCKDLPPPALRDRLLTIADEYTNKAKEYRIKTTNKPWEVILNSTTLVKCVGSGILGAFVSGGIVAPASVEEIAKLGMLNCANPSAAASILAGMSLIFDFGRATLAHKQALAEERVYLSNHPAHWVFLAKDRLAHREKQNGWFTRLVNGSKSLMRRS